MAKELANKQAVIEAHENQLVDYYQSILKLKVELKMAQEKNDAQNQMESALVREKEALKQELEDKVTLDEENTMKIVELNEELVKAKKEIKAHDENRSQGHQSLVEDLQGEISKALVQNHELKEAVFTITKKNEGLREQLENNVKREKNLNGKIVRMTNMQDQMKKELSAKDVISSLKKELQKKDLENFIKEEGMGDVERCETAAEGDKKIVVVKEEKQEEDGPQRKLLIKKPKKKKPKRDKVSYSWAPLGSIVQGLETGENKVHNERSQEEKIQNKCEERRNKASCKAKVEVHIPRSEVVGTFHNHTHEPSKAKIDAAKTIQRVNMRAISTEGTVQQILSEACGSIDEETGANLPPIHHLRRYIRRHRQRLSRSRPLPLNAQELVLTD
ncbi:M protein, serotype 5-like [Palaemon carinicauda]|uniref:M protein, serotype 5-like n=1 Tax=Palaemon carinicauda TaxID=392227 RepID=UPI0035B58426